MNQLANDVVVRAGFELYGDVAREGSFNLRQQWQQWVEETLKTAEQEDVLADDVSPQGAAHAIVAATVGFEVLGSTDKSWLSKQSITCFWELMLPRLAAGPALGEVDSAGSARTVNSDEEPSKDVFARKNRPTRLIQAAPMEGPSSPGGLSGAARGRVRVSPLPSPLRTADSLVIARFSPPCGLLRPAVAPQDVTGIAGELESRPLAIWS